MSGDGELRDDVEDLATDRLQSLLVERSERGTGRGASAVLAGAEASADSPVDGRPVRTDDARHRRVRAIMAAAAALVLVVGAVSVLATRRDDGSSTVAGTSTVAPMPPAEARWAELPPWAVPAGRELVQPGEPIAIGDGVVLLVRGPAPQRRLTDLARFTPSTGRWETIPAPPDTSGSHAVWTGRELVVFGMQGKDSLVEVVFDPAGGAWRQLPEGVRRARGPHLRSVWTGTRVVSWDEHGEVVSWDPVTDVAEVLAFGAAGNDPLADGDASRWPFAPAWSFVVDNRLVVAGGKPTRAAVFDLTTRQWTKFGSPDDSATYGAAAWTGSQLLLLDVRRRSLVALDLVTGRWAPRAPWPLGETLGDLSGVWDGRRLVTWGMEPGSDGRQPGPMRSAAYDPAADRWEPDDAPPSSVGQAVVLPDGSIVATSQTKADPRGSTVDPITGSEVDPTHPNTIVYGAVRRSGSITPPNPELPQPSGRRTAEELAALRTALLGRREDDARRIAEASGWQLRAVRDDSRPSIGVNHDLDTSRVNVSLIGGRILGIPDLG